MIKNLKYTGIFLIGLLSGCINDNEPEGPSLSVGDPLPVFTVVMNTGETVTSASLKGKISVIDFFNTGCPDCRQEFPVIQQLWDLYKDDTSVKIVSISREEGEESVAAYWEAHNLDFPYSAQDNRDVYSLFAPSVIPRIYISDTEGIIRFIYTDDPLASLKTLVNSIESLSL